MNFLDDPAPDVVLRALIGSAPRAEPAHLEVHRGQVVAPGTPAHHARIRAALAALRAAEAGP